MRPFMSNELAQANKPAWRINSASKSIECNKITLYDKPFYFDHIFTEEVTNDELYSTCIQSLIAQSFSGIDTTIFAYGQTGAGKTHTILGHPRSSRQFDGIAFRVVEDIFKHQASLPQNEQLAVSCSYIEVYNEQVFDLLNKPETFHEPLQIYEDQKLSRFRIAGNVKVKIESLKELEEVMTYGEENRTYGETCFNMKSSRSHTLFTVNVIITNYVAGEEFQRRESTINIVDLAGNERLLYDSNDKYASHARPADGTPDKPSKRSTSTINNRGKFGTSAQDFKTNEKETRTTESKNINKSLFFLTQVIYLSSKNSQNVHIPFRNSTLTKILRSSFGGRSRTILVLCLSPTMGDAEISLSSLRFGRCAKLVENMVKPNIVTNNANPQIEGIVQQYDNRIAELEKKISVLAEHRNPIPDVEEYVRKLKGMIGNAVMADQSAADRDVIQKRVGLPQISTQRVNEKAGILTFRQINKFGAQNASESECLFACPRCKIQKEVELLKPISDKPFANAFRDKRSQLESLAMQIGGYFDQISSMHLIWEEQVNSSLNLVLSTDESVRAFLLETLDELRSLRERLSFYEKRGAFEALSDQELDLKCNQLKRLTKAYQDEKLTRQVCSKLPIDDPRRLEKESRIRTANEELKAEKHREEDRVNAIISKFELLTKTFAETKETLTQDVHIGNYANEAQKEIGILVNQIETALSTLGRSVGSNLVEKQKLINSLQGEVKWLNKYHDASKLKQKEAVDDRILATGPLLSRAKFKEQSRSLSPQNPLNGPLASKLRPLLDHLLAYKALCRMFQMNAKDSQKPSVEQRSTGKRSSSANSKKRPEITSTDKLSDIQQMNERNESMFASFAEKIQMFKRTQQNNMHGQHTRTNSIDSERSKPTSEQLLRAFEVEANSPTETNPSDRKKKVDVSAQKFGKKDAHQPVYRGGENIDFASRVGHVSFDSAGNVEVNQKQLKKPQPRYSEALPVPQTGDFQFVKQQIPSEPVIQKVKQSEQQKSSTYTAIHDRPKAKNYSSLRKPKN